MDDRQESLFLLLLAHGQQRYPVVKTSLA
jgi:hypothetical protein